jgi:3-oxoadipate enol-lactonase
MVGAKNDVATTAIAKGIHEQIPDSRLAEFHTGHFIMAEDPDAFQAVLGEFLNKVKAERS